MYQCNKNVICGLQIKLAEAVNESSGRVRSEEVQASNAVTPEPYSACSVLQDLIPFVTGLRSG